ncbi:hypothetical protein JQ596_09300 [Bradyrhizobium manausense]|uniref:hypothetical protein n=1 Tax=Bradyrhizobium TaxID=374 RepID=UPI001BA942C5|nr:MULTISPECIES: hypothetical protein [Bradyrhizobium]MBR0825733.1 hypothetical protein [Bradyrhizobium manausense]UVO31321.1 hypothetical protein KUF59_12050 [Bradyrhizobium arachidis]
MAPPFAQRQALRMFRAELRLDKILPRAIARHSIAMRQIMRRACGIVNEMEFRMLRVAQTFSPSSRAGTTKRFFARNHATSRATAETICTTLKQIRRCAFVFSQTSL